MEFSLNRVWLLIKKQFAENLQFYFFGVLAMADIVLAVFLFNLIDRVGLTVLAQCICFQYGLAIFGTIFTSTLFNQYADKIKGAQILVLPASQALKN